MTRAGLRGVSPLSFCTDPDDECPGAEVCLAGLSCGTPGADAGTLVDSSMPVDATTPIDAHVATPAAGTMHATGGCCGVAGAGSSARELIGVMAIALLVTVRRRRRR